MKPAAQTREAVAYLDGRLRAGDAGKTLLVGLRDGRPCLALAAGLRGAEDHPNFITLASYLLRRESADAYWLALPAVTAEGEILALELRSGGVSHVAHCPAQLAGSVGSCHLEVAEAQPAAPLLGDLLHQTSPVPGRMRRSLDEMAEAFGVPLPEIGDHV